MAGRTDPEKVNNTDFNGGVNYTAQRTMVSDREMDKLVEGVLYAQKKAEEAANLVAGDNITITQNEDGATVISATANNAFIDLSKLVENGSVSITKLNSAIAQAYASKDPACARVNIYISAEQALSVDLSSITFIGNCNYYFNAAGGKVLYTGSISLSNVANCDFYGLTINSNGSIYMEDCSNLQFFNCHINGSSLVPAMSLSNCSDMYFDNCQIESTRPAINISGYNTLNKFEWIMFENCIFHMGNTTKVLTATGANNPNEIITFANCYYNDMTLVTKERVDYNPNGARINVALYEITSLSTEQVNEIADGVFEN